MVRSLLDFLCIICYHVLSCVVHGISSLCSCLSLEWKEENLGLHSAP